MKNIIILLIISLFCSCKVIDDPIDTGICISNTDETMWEYFVKDTKNNWDSIIVAIEYADIKYMFDGSDPEYKELTFFGITNMSIQMFLYQNELNSIHDLTPEKCKSMLLSHIVPGKVMKDDCDFEVKGTNEGGSMLTSITGKKIRAYRIKSPGIYGPESGPQYLAIHAQETGFKADVASSDIEVKNGVVHSLSYSYVWAEL